MEWLTGLALMPALVCTAMMGSMALAGAIGWRRTQGVSSGGDVTTSADTEPTRTLEDAGQ
jgi:hypothetical protein